MRLRPILSLLVVASAACGSSGSPGEPCLPSTGAASVVDPSIDADGVRGALATALAETQTAGAAVAIGRDGRVLFAEAFGSADAGGRPLRLDTPILIASSSKLVVAVAVMQLVERGALGLDDDVDLLLARDGVRLRNPAHPAVAITPRMLLTHTSSIVDVASEIDATWYVRGDSPIAIRDYVTGYFTAGSPYYAGPDGFLAEAPGSAICYSNIGVGVLSRLVELASEQGFAAYCQEHIFAPLGMTRTAWRIDAFCDQADLARGLRPAGDGFADADNGDQGQPEGHPEIASGMLRTTAPDLLAFLLATDAALAGQGSLLSAASAAELVEVQLTDAVTECIPGHSPPDQQALLFRHAPAADGDWVGHYGGMEGFTSAAWVRSSDGLSYALLLNTGDAAALGSIEQALVGAL